MKIILYLCNMKRSKTSTSMKTMVLAVAFLFTAGALSAQQTGFGIGITTPQATLHVHSEYDTTPLAQPDPMTRLDPEPPGPNNPDPVYLNTVLLTNPNTGTTSADGFIISQCDGNVTLTQQESGYLRFVNHNATLEFTASGVGVGNAQSGYKFNVDGTSRFAQQVTMVGGFTAGNGLSCDAQGNLQVKHLKVTLTGWPDYVFGGNHALMPLGELESYIKEYSHLPGVPTAEEVEKEGADLGEMNRVLMEKVEELTLYIIDLQKQIDELKSNK